MLSCNFPYYPFLYPRQTDLNNVCWVAVPAVTTNQSNGIQAPPGNSSTRPNQIQVRSTFDADIDQEIGKLYTKARNNLDTYNELSKQYICSCMKAFEKGDIDAFPKHPFVPPLEEVEQAINRRRATLIEKVQADDWVKRLEVIKHQHGITLKISKKNEEAFHVPLISQSSNSAIPVKYPLQKRSCKKVHRHIKTIANARILNLTQPIKRRVFAHDRKLAPLERSAPKMLDRNILPELSMKKRPLEAEKTHLECFPGDEERDFQPGRMCEELSMNKKRKIEEHAPSIKHVVPLTPIDDTEEDSLLCSCPEQKRTSDQALE
ncbi:hypothetical protein ACHAWF_013770 [Thalassiosira exigua]